MGETPHGFFRGTVHSVSVLMLKHEMVKAVFSKTGRSGFHYFLTSLLFVNRTTEAMFDFLGGAMVVSMLMGMVFLMRFLLAH